MARRQASKPQPANRREPSRIEPAMRSPHSEPAPVPAKQAASPSSSGGKRRLLIGGALMSWINLGVSPGMFITRLQENTSVWHFAVGIIKAPFFAMVIAVIACWQATLVRGSAESVGQRTTTSVVLSIFAVIVIDALFSIVFSAIGV